NWSVAWRRVTYDIDAYGRILIAADCDDKVSPGVIQPYLDFCVSRITARGTVDTSFGDNGIKRFRPNPSANNLLQSVSSLPNGKIVVGARCGVDSSSKALACTIQLTESGNFDSTYGTSAFGETRASAFGLLSNTRLLRDGRLLIFGECSNAIINGGCTVVYATNGSIESIIQYPPPPNFGDSVSITAIVPAFDTDLVSLYDTIALIFPSNSGGSFVSRMVTGGQYSSFTVEIPGNAIQHDGRSLRACPFVNSVQPGAFCTQRINADYSLDTTFVSATAVGFGPSTSRAIQNDDRLLVVGNCSNTGAAVAGFCGARFLLEPESTQCRSDLDGDGRTLLTTDSLLLTRISLGLPASSLLTGINFSNYATRNTWRDIKRYLEQHCNMRDLP
ncbi:MAG: hypothetical protein ACRCWJ_14675, partial [Casimicrobium sp.]